MESFRQYLDKKETVYGVFAKTNDPFFIHVMGRAGFDYVILDNEHGPNSPRDTYPLIAAASATGMYPIVRVGKLDDITIQRTLDLGVAGIQIPQIQSGDDAERARMYSKYAPLGKRGVCRYVMPADGGLKERNQYFAEQNDVAVIIHIEGKEGLDHFDDIVAVEGIDVIFIGPNDLSQSLGVLGQVEHPKVIGAIETIVGTCKDRGKHVGVFCDSVQAAKRYKDLGIKYISISVDVGIFAEACRSMVDGLKSL